MNTYDKLMEMVIEDDNIVLESVLNKAGLKKEDLQDPEKVKKALTHLNGITDEYEKRNSVVSIITGILEAITALTTLTNLSMTGKVATILSTLLIKTISEIARYNLAVSDYRKLIGKIDKEIKITTERINRLSKKEDTEDQIDDLEEIRNNLRKSKDEILKRMQKENKIEGKDEKINPTPQNPISAFTGMV